jgi:hypothetical protein
MDTPRTNTTGGVDRRCKSARLEDLPVFTIRKLDVQTSEVILTGVFSHLTSVRPGRGWLYKPNDASLQGDVVAIDHETRQAVMSVDKDSLPPDFSAGASFPYFFGYFEPSIVDLILDAGRDWQKVEYQPTDSQQIVGEFPTGPLYGEIEVGAPVPPGFRVVRIVGKGWSKEKCALCNEAIGPAHQKFGYRDVRDIASGLNSVGYWLCEHDYQCYASKHDLGFLLD